MGSSGSRQGKVARSYEHGNQRSGSIKCGEFLDYRAAGRMARVHNMARSIHYCHNFFYFFCPTSVSILWRIHIRTHTHTHTHTHTSHISGCVKIVYALPSLPSTTACQTLLRKSGTVRSADWTFIIVALPWRWLGEHVTLDKSCTAFFSNRK